MDKDYSTVKAAQFDHYTRLCNSDTFPHSLPCRLTRIVTNRSSSNIKPIRLWLNTTKKKYKFEDIRSNCSFTIIASFDDCHPKDCRNPFRQIQNGIINYLQDCQLSYEICWPVIHHIKGIKQLDALINSLNNYFKINVDIPRFNRMLYWYYYFMYPFDNSQCTKDVINAIDMNKLNFSDILSVLKFVQHTRPDLSPLLIFKHIDKAVFKREIFNNEPLKIILDQVSAEVSSSNWLIPIIATSTDKNWFLTARLITESMKEYFPFLISIDV